MRCKAYERRLDNQAWVNGQYVHLALISALSAVMSKDNYIDYPDMPLTEKKKKKKEREAIQPSNKKYDDIALQKDQEYRDLWMTLY